MYEALRARGLHFPNELVTSYLLSLKTKPFLILSGISGTGKTKLAQAVAEWAASETRVVDETVPADEDSGWTFAASVSTLNHSLLHVSRRHEVLLDLPQEGTVRIPVRFDEMWNGVLHMPPLPSFEHQRLVMALCLVLGPLAKEGGLVPSSAGVFRPGAEKDYRVPDLSFVKPEHASRRGIEGRAELAVEILSPDDESYAKLPFYEQVGVQELLILDPSSRMIELFELHGGKLVAGRPDDSGALRSTALGVTFRTVEGPKLRVAWSGGTSEV